MSAVPALRAAPESGRRAGEVAWDQIGRTAPRLAATVASYLDQLAVSARPGTIEAVELSLRLFCAWLVEFDPRCKTAKAIGRDHVEAYKAHLAARTNAKGKPLASKTLRMRLGMLRTFCERIIEYDYDDAPKRVPVFESDLPHVDEPLPKFLDDPTAAKFMAAVAADPNPRRKLMIELLARTGMRVGELSALEDDAVVRIGDTHWLRIPLGKLHNDRYVPLLPALVEEIRAFQALRGPSRSGRLVERDDGMPFDRRTIQRYVVTVARRAGVGHVHPHQLRHTLATQAINRGMSLEAIAALLGHRSMDMTLVYARISDRTVAEEYFRVTDAVEQNYERARVLPAAVAGKNMRKLAADHRRLLGNGHCNRPKSLDCAFETVCERCGFFETGPQFVTILRRQRDHSAARGQDARAELFGELVNQVTNDR